MPAWEWAWLPWRMPIAMGPWHAFGPCAMAANKAMRPNMALATLRASQVFEKRFGGLSSLFETCCHLRRTLRRETSIFGIQTSEVWHLRRRAVSLSKNRRTLRCRCWRPRSCTLCAPSGAVPDIVMAVRRMRAAIDVARCPWCRPVRSSGLLIERLCILVPDQHNTIPCHPSRQEQVRCRWPQHACHSHISPARADHSRAHAVRPPHTVLTAAPVPTQPWARPAQ